jgi:hypothetical protein
MSQDAPGVDPLTLDADALQRAALEKVVDLHPYS